VSQASLDIRGLTKAFSGVHAVEDVSFTVPTGSVTGLIGPNGSGKTTILDCITGFLDADRGEVLLDGESILGVAPHALARMGLVRTFQGPHGYPRLTVLDHMLLGSQEFHGVTWWQSFRLSREAEASERDAIERSRELLSMVRLADRAHERAGNLSYGQQKLLSLVAALMGDPRIVLLDEPLAGVTPAMIDEVQRAIGRLNDLGHTFLIVEHNVRFVTAVCSSIVALDAGRKLAEGPPSTIWEDERIYEAYLGARSTP
jgi:branched-chain amino acid transport system ATP-binding protein